MKLLRKFYPASLFTLHSPSPRRFSKSFHALQSGAMAGIKRKNGSDSKSQAIHTAKKPKKEHKSANPSKPSKIVQELEAETDSDPIVESDTTSQSGDNDGVSWPSDEDNEEVDEWGGVSGEDEDDTGGVKAAAKAADGAPPATKGGARSDANPSKQSL